MIKLRAVAYSVQIGLRYLRSKKRSAVSIITVIAVLGVALGVAALLAVLSITSGFQEEFRQKILGVNAHVLVLKYGDFDEYRDVIKRVESMDEVAAAGPFMIHPMLLTKGDRIGGVLVKGVDPQAAQAVLALPEQLVEGTLDGLRKKGATAPISPRGADESDGDYSFLKAIRDSLDEAIPDAKVSGVGLADEGASEDDPLRGVDAEKLVEHILSADGGFLLPDGGLPPDVLEAREPAADDGKANDVAGANAGGSDDGASKAGAPTQHVNADAPPEDTWKPLPSVDVASPEAVEQALLDEAELGLPELTPEQEEQFFAEQEELDRREDDGLEELPVVVIGKTLATDLGIGVGDRVSLISRSGGAESAFLDDSTPAGPSSVDFRVGAIFEVGFQEYDSRLVYVDIYEAQRFSNRGDIVDGVELRLNDIGGSLKLARRIESTLSGPFHTLDWSELNRNLFTALEIQKVILSLIFASIICVAAFNVIATLIMIVLEKKREVAILKAMGANDRTILGIFMMQGTVIGIVGTAIGLVLGGGVVLYLSHFRFPLDPKVYLIDHVPAVANPIVFVVTLVVALAICTLATVLPSWWAARMMPVDGLRYE